MWRPVKQSDALVLGELCASVACVRARARARVPRLMKWRPASTNFHRRATTAMARLAMVQQAHA